MAKIRVLHCCNILDLGGEKSILIHSKYADKTRFEVFACGRLYGGRRVPEFEKLGISVYLAPLSAIGRFHPRVVETFGCVIAEAITNRLPVVSISHPSGRSPTPRSSWSRTASRGSCAGFSGPMPTQSSSCCATIPCGRRWGSGDMTRPVSSSRGGKITRRLEQIYLDLMDQPS